MPVGTCPCGARDVTLVTTRYKVLIDRGMTDPICRSCEQRVVGKLRERRIAELRAKGLKAKEIEAALADFDAKVSDAEPVEQPKPAQATAAAPTK